MVCHIDYTHSPFLRVELDLKLRSPIFQILMAMRLIWSIAEVNGHEFGCIFR